MIYRIRIDLAFDHPDPVNDILDKAKDHFQDAHTLNPGEPNEQRGYIISEHCFHDQSPFLPCIVIEEHWTP